MADFCLECWDKINKGEEKPGKYIVSKELSLCEGCGELKKVILYEKKYYYAYKFRFIIFPFKIIYNILFFVFRLVALPYLIYKYKKNK